MRAQRHPGRHRHRGRFLRDRRGGAEAEREIARIATEAGVTLMGPNCMGIISNEVSLHAIGFVVLHPPKGKLSFVSQSGNMGVQTTSACQRRGIGIDKFVSVGNEAQIGAVEASTICATTRTPRASCSTSRASTTAGTSWKWPAGRRPSSPWSSCGAD